MINISTYIFMFSLSTVWSGIMLAIGFSIGKWFISYIETKRAMRSATVNQFIQKYREREQCLN